jgi:hypothetical protein
VVRVLALGRALKGRAAPEWLTGALPSDVDGLGRPAIACLAAAAAFSLSPEVAPTLLVLRNPRLDGGAVTCAGEWAREMGNDVDVILVVTFLAVKEVV